MEMTNTKQYLTGFPYESDYSVSVMVVYSAVKGITGSYTLWGRKIIMQRKMLVVVLNHEFPVMFGQFKYSDVMLLNCKISSLMTTFEGSLQKM